MTHRDRESETPEGFWKALMAAYADMFITWDEAVAAYNKFVRERPTP